MCLRLVFLLITRVITWLRLSRREEIWKTAEILLLRHQVTVLKRHQARRPKLNWADRALRTTLFGVIPKRAARGCDCWSPASPPPKGGGNLADRQNPQLTALRRVLGRYRPGRTSRRRRRRDHEWDVTPAEWPARA